ncbi:MAG: hypothetical protein ABH811_01365 [archaeon]
MYTPKHLKERCFLNIYIKTHITLGIYPIIINKMDHKMKDNFDIFFRRKPALMLVFLNKNLRMRYGSLLAKEVDCTYSHAVKILQTLEFLKLVEFEKKGRIKLIKLTKRGKEVASAIENIQKLVK